MFQPKLYAKTNFFNQNFLRKLLQEYSAKMGWQPGTSLVDIGTGTGVSLVEEVLPYIPDFTKVIGIDSSKEMIEFAMKKYSNIPNLNFNFGDIQNKEEFDNFKGEFDYATSFSCLMTIPNQLKALETIKSLLKPGGKCLLSIIVDAPYYPTYKSLSKEEKWKDYLENMKKVLSPYHFLDDACHEMEKYLTMSEFSKFEVTLREDTEFYEVKHDCIDFLKSLTISSIIPTNMKKEFFDRILEDFHRFGHIKDGGCEFTCKTLVVHATS